MNKIFLILLILMAMAVPTVTAELLIDPTVPATVLPGSFFTLSIKVTNTDTVAHNDIDVNLDLPGSFDIEEETRSISSLAPSQSAVVQWSIEVDSGAISGYKVITAEVDSSSSSREEIDIPVLVKASESTLEILNVESNPRILEPGASGTITLALQNHASYSLHDIHVNLELSSTIPIAPRDGTEERIVKNLSTRESSSVQFEVTILPNAEPGIYTVPVQLTYVDEFGQNYSRVNTITVEVNAIPQLEITTEGKVVQGRLGEITIKVVNKGLTPIQFLTIHLQHPAVISSPSMYIGDLEQDDFQTEQITILAQEPLQISATVEFRDALNKAYKEQILLPVSVIDTATAKQLGLEKTSLWFYPIVIIVVLIIIYIVRKRLKKRKTKP